MDAKALEEVLSRLVKNLPENDAISLSLFFTGPLFDEEEDEEDEDINVLDGAEIFTIREDTKIEFIENTMVFFDTTTFIHPTWQLVDLTQVVRSHIHYIHEGT